MRLDSLLTKIMLLCGMNVKNSDIKGEKDNYKGEKTIKVGLLLDTKPICYKENDELKGIEVELEYYFAKNKNYNVELEEFMNIEDRMKIGEEDTDFNGTDPLTQGIESTTSEKNSKLNFLI